MAAKDVMDFTDASRLPADGEPYPGLRAEPVADSAT